MNKKILTSLTILATLIGMVGWHPVSAISPPILITELQTGFIDSNGIEWPKQEFIELTNISGAAVDITGWRLEYLSAANDGTTGLGILTIDTINGQLAANGHGLWEHEGYYPASPDSIFGYGDTNTSGYFAKTGGHVRLMSGTTMIDCVSWGSAVAISGCDKANVAAPAGYTLQRKLIDGTYDKTAGVINMTPATPQGGNIYAVNVIPPVIVPPTNPVVTTPAPDCDGIQLSEILANPAGDDATGEFIELYNPMDHDQTLYGCSLKLSSGKEYAFTTIDSIASHEYKAFMYSSTALQLSNSGGTITLVSASQQASTTYPAVTDDQSWALIADSWSITKQPTPGLPNASTSTSDSTVTATVIDSSEPCPEGKYRNPDTNRCRNIIADNPLTACPVGQERNPTTGRCRKTVVTATQTPCQADQVRNPDTGRCKKIEVAAVQKPCEAGQERSPDTGRCRKITASSGKVMGATTAKLKTYHYVLISAVLAAVVGYGVYEYRHDIRSIPRRIKQRRGKA